MTGTRFRFTCRYCRRVVIQAASRLTAEALDALRDHVRREHPDVGLTAEAGAGAILAHCDVELVP